MSEGGSVIDRFGLPVPLDALSAVVYAAVFVGVVLVTMRRPGYGLAALVFVQPFAWHHDVMGTTITISKVALLGALVGLFAHPRLVGALRERRLLMVLLAFAALFVATLATIVVAAHHGPVLRETSKVAEYCALLVVAYAAYRLDRDDTIVLAALAASVTLVCASALAEEALGAPSVLFLNGKLVPRIAGVLEGPNQLAAYLEIAIALLGAWCVALPSRLAQIALALGGCTLMLTFSRGGIVGAVIVCGVLVWLYRGAALRALLPLFGGVAAGVAGGLAWTLSVHGHAAGILRVSPTLGTTYAGGVGTRSELWRAAIHFFRAHPVLGIGAGNYELELADAGVYGVRTHANSWYLQSLAEGGIVLFGAVIAFIAVVLTTLVRGIRSSPWTAGAAAASIALVVHQIADFLWFYTKVGGPWMLAIGIGIAAISAAASDERT